MHEVDLHTRAGGYVITVRLFPMNPMPEVIQWGSRVFIRETDSKYNEGLLWFSLPGNEYFKDQGE